MPAPSSVRLPPQPLLLVILAGLGTVGPFSIDTIFPAFQQMGPDLGVSALALQQLVSVYLLSFAVMSLFHGPLSDALGRKPVILVGGAVYVLASVGCALAPNLNWLLVGRAVQGLSAGAGQIIARAMVRDLFEGGFAQRVMSHIAMIFGVAPALAPIVGGWLLGAGNWRAIFWFLVVYGSALFVLVLVALPETHPVEARTPLRLGPLAAGLWTVARHRDGRRLALTGMLNFAGMFLYISAASIFVVDLLGKGAQDFWLLFVPLIFGMVAGSWTASRLVSVNGRRLATAGYAISLAGAAVNLGFSLVPATPGLPWAVVALPVYSFGIAIAFPILTLAMLDLFPHNRGAASSVQTFVSLVANALLAGVVAPLVAFSLWSLALGSLLLTLLAWMLWLRHLRVTRTVPDVPAEPAALEPTDEL